jgi:hypothetical protein
MRGYLIKLKKKESGERGTSKNSKGVADSKSLSATILIDRGQSGHSSKFLSRINLFNPSEIFYGG